MRDIVLATGNPAKLVQLRWLVEGLPIRVLTPADLPDASPTIDEDGPDFGANAAQKAQGWSLACGGILTLASDGGLEIPALGARWTALRTRRNAGPGADDTDRIRHLLDLMRVLRGADRRTIWHEAVALALDGVLLHTWTADGDGGLIASEYRPTPGSLANWTEHLRYYPAVGKLYRDLSPAELEAINGVWPRLRTEIQAYLRA